MKFILYLLKKYLYIMMQGWIFKKKYCVEYEIVLFIKYDKDETSLLAVKKNFIK